MTHKQKMFGSVSSKISFFTILIILLISLAFIISAITVRNNAEADCIERIEETTVQIADMFTTAVQENQKKLSVFADMLGINFSNPDDQLRAQMENFCMTQAFTSICLHRADGTHISCGELPHDDNGIGAFETEAARVPYVSHMYAATDDARTRCYYHAVPIRRGGDIVAIVYGFIPLSVLPDFISCTAYDRKPEFYVIDGDTGDFLMDEHHTNSGNLFDDTLPLGTIGAGYDIDTIRKNIKNGESGHFICKLHDTNDWYYTYYMPLQINNWTIQMTVDEPTAFENFRSISRTVAWLAGLVIGLVLLLILLFLWYNHQVHKKEKHNLDRSTYISEVQRNLINAHHNPDFVARALRVICRRTASETALLLTFVDKTIRGVYYSPSKDKMMAMKLVGLHIEEEFPMLYDVLSTGESFVFDGVSEVGLSDTAKNIFEHLEVSNIMLVPILDMAGNLKGAVAAANMEDVHTDTEMLSCITYDLLMAINNLENHTIIRNMGIMDYLTGVKNRNSYESELESYATTDAESLWCVFVDVNGLHEVNNRQGHKAGDLMLCAVASTVKKIFGEAHTYRLGGDEFVAFTRNSTQEAMLHHKRRMTDDLASKGYFVSVGFASAQKNTNGSFDIESLVGAAESLMYKEKHKYYERNHISAQRDYTN